MSKRTPDACLEDILECIHRIEHYLEKINYHDFVTDTLLQDAVVRNLEIIGEAVKKVPAEIQGDNPKIPWKAMAGTRDNLIHDYFGVNLDIVWDICVNDLPQLIPNLEALLLNRDS